jgi:hypothetical protein
MRKRQMKFKTLSLAGIAIAMFSAPALAHHSFAMFDGETYVTLEGSVKEFQWTYPHAWILMMVADEDGQEQQWALELPSPGGLARNGWLPKSLTPGMEIVALAHPLKNGEPGGSALTVTLPDGTVLEGP